MDIGLVCWTALIGRPDVDQRCVRRAPYFAKSDAVGVELPFVSVGSHRDVRLVVPYMPAGRRVKQQIAEPGGVKLGLPPKCKFFSSSVRGLHQRQFRSDKQHARQTTSAYNRPLPLHYVVSCCPVRDVQRPLCDVYYGPV